MSNRPAASVTIAVAVDSPHGNLYEKAVVLSKQLGLHMHEDHASEVDLLLTVEEDRIALHETGARSSGGVYVDFVNGPLGYRRRCGASRRQLIARAVGVTREPLSVVDATAGLGRDMFSLACLGCSVVAVERSPILAALIRDGLSRAGRADIRELDDVIARISLVVDDARSALAAMTGDDAPDVVYLDPMYPPKKKAAASKKELRICRRLVGDDADAGELFDVACNSATRRVVVKRRPDAPPLGPKPLTQYTSKLVRYDVYHPR